MIRNRLYRAVVLSAFLAVAGCSGPAGNQDRGGAATSEYHLATEPANAVAVAELVKSAKNEDQVVVVGRIGGNVNPWVEGTAAFLLIDESLTPCNEREDDACPTPWDYCCDDVDLIKTSTVLVKFVDEEGAGIATDAKTLLNLKELDTVVIRGQAKRDEAGNLTVLADGLFVRG